MVDHVIYVLEILQLTQCSYMLKKKSNLKKKDKSPRAGRIAPQCGAIIFQFYQRGESPRVADSKIQNRNQIIKRLKYMSFYL